MSLLTKLRRDNADDDDNSGDVYDDDGFDAGHDEDAPRIEPPRNMSRDTHHPDEGDLVDTSDEDRPRLTSRMAASVQFQVSSGQGYFFPQVEEFCDQAAKSLRWHEANSHELEDELNQKDVELRAANVQLRRQSAQMSILQATGDLVVDPDGSPVSADGQLAQMQNELAESTNRIEVLTGELAAAHQQISEQQSEVEGLHRDLSSAREAQRAAENRATMFERALENARQAGLTGQEAQTVPAPVAGEGVSGAVVDDDPDFEDDVIEDVVDDDVVYVDDDDVVDVDDVVGDAPDEQNDEPEGSSLDASWDVVDEVVDDVEDVTPAPDNEPGEHSPQDTFEEASTEAHMEEPGSEDVSVDSTRTVPAAQEPLVSSNNDQAGDGDADPGPAQDAQPTPEPERPSGDRFAAWAAAAAAEPVIDNPAPKEPAPTRVIRPGDPLNLDGRDMDDYAPELTSRPD